MSAFSFIAGKFWLSGKGRGIFCVGTTGSIKGLHILDHKEGENFGEVREKM